MAQNHLSSYIINNALGDNHKALGSYNKGEAAYRKSTFMVPAMLLPKYLLAKLYVKSDQKKKAQQTAKNILNSPIKIESTATNEIMKEMRSILTLKPSSEPETQNSQQERALNSKPKTRNPKLIN